jgi:O-acetyl-ADP-ribose deacetylase (regulator of RNase III)
VIQVVVDDLALIEADAVLRPSTDSLAPVGPAAARLDQAAGPEFAALRTTREPLDIGAAIVTGAGQLASEFVVHVVIHTDRHKASRATIERALTSAWQRAREWGLRTVATTPLGVGVCLEFDEASELLIQSFRARGNSEADSGELTIVIEDQADRARLEAIIARGGAAS